MNQMTEPSPVDTFNPVNLVETGPRDMIHNVVNNYPDFIRTAPFCCWKKGKVPYNPKTGKKAKVDDVKTFGTLAETYRAYMNERTYKGIGIKISGQIGAIDLDKCVADDVAFNFKPLTAASLSKNARTVISLFPDAVVELSPSRKGLHLFFRVPDGFKFDSDEYYINNRKLGIEVYVGDSSNRFVTVTGNVIVPLASASASTASTASTASAMSDSASSASSDNNINTLGATDEAATPDKAVSGSDKANDVSGVDKDADTSALMTFLNLFMKRPQAKLAEIKLPEGGSILSDEEVLRKAKNGKNGEKFEILYRGEWELIPRLCKSNSDSSDSVDDDADNSNSSVVDSDSADYESIDRIGRIDHIDRANWSHSDADMAL